MIVIIDYGMGNLRSILFKLQKINIEAMVSSSPSEIERADKLILPGVGHFAKGMENIRKYGLLDILNKKVLVDKTPVMGICLGVQLFTKFSQEGDCEGLGWVDAETIKFRFSEKNSLPIPHIGWNHVRIKQKSVFWPEIPEDKRFYFVHSYYIKCNNDKDVLGISEYGHEFVSVLQKENIFGTQFHPEKSHRDGFELVKHFAEMDYIKC